MTERAPRDAFDEAFFAHRPYLVDLAFRMLGDVGEAEDVVQEAFSRLLVPRDQPVEDERGWLTVVVSRLCLDRIRSARSRLVRSVDFEESEPALGPQADATVDPADRVTLDDSVRLALVVLMEQLSPAERVVFVLHDVFQLPYEQVASVVGRSVASCRQLSHRARERIEQDASSARFTLDASLHQRVTERFITACSTGDFAALLEVLAPDAAGDVDLGAGGPSPGVVHGARRVAANLVRYWGEGATLVSLPVGREPLVLAYRERVLAGLLVLTVAGGDDRIAKIHVVADPVKLGFLRTVLPSPT
jgi:RNA polymerase sigma-70 factor (ECF subfamily)